MATVASTAPPSSIMSSLPKVVITGGTGNLGSKLSHHLLSYQPPRYRVHLIEHPAYFRKDRVPPGVEVTLGDVANVQDVEWFSALEGADAVVHFSAVNPYPNANWSESAQSMDHIFNVMNVAALKGVRRVVFATSNHVMGQYKDADPPLEAGTLEPDLPPNVGTSLRDAAALKASGDAVAYATAKLAGERLAASLAALYAPKTTFVCLRIGWCQPGDNLPETLSAAGSPPEFQSETDASEDEKRGDDLMDENWFKGMWLSNRDFLAYFESALNVDVPLLWKEEESPTKNNPHQYRKKGFLLLNAMSKNTGAKWALTKTEEHLGVISQDDSFR